MIYLQIIILIVNLTILYFAYRGYRQTKKEEIEVKGTVKLKKDEIEAMTRRANEAFARLKERTA